MAARDYEDLLQVYLSPCPTPSLLLTGYQCAMPVFDRLFEEPHNQIVQDLLFLCACWHGLAKLRMHTDKTLEVLEKVTFTLGAAFQKFISTTCAAYATYELPREVQARNRRTAKKMAKNASTANEAEALAPQDIVVDAVPATSRRRKDFNLATYKYHALADYPNTIRLYGTSDSYSTELVSGCILASILS